MSLYIRDHHANIVQGRDNCPTPEKRRANEAIAKSAGFTNYKQYGRAETIAAKRPDLLEKIDTGAAAICGTLEAENAALLERLNETEAAS